MARKISITEEMYQSYINEEIDQGRLLSDIKPTEVFKNVGGSFVRASKALESMQDRVKNTAPIRELPRWFIEWKTSLISHVAQTAESAWFTLGTQLDDELNVAKAGFETLLEKLNGRIDSRDEQIMCQEIEIDTLKAEIDKLEVDASSAVRDGIRHDLELTHSIKQIDELKVEAVKTQTIHEKRVNDLSAARRTIDAQDQRITSLEKERNIVESELKLITVKLAISIASLKSSSELKDDLKSELATARKDIYAVTTELNILKPKYGQLQCYVPPYGYHLIPNYLS